MPGTTAIFTICSNNYVAQASVFFDSVRQHLPDADLYLGLADEPAADPASPEGVSVIRADELRIPDFRSFAFGYGVMEFNTAIKPFMFLRLFERGYRQVLYFDPDIMVFSPLEAIFAGLERGASFILTPHLCSPPAVDAWRTEFHVMRTGIYNLGFLACSAQPETETTLRWWARKLRHDCINDQAKGIFVDQKFMDLVPGFTDHTLILRDTAMNVAYWNLSQRKFGRDESGWTVDGRALGFFHFSGFDPRHPSRLTKHIADAIIPNTLEEFLGLYAKLLLDRPQKTAPPYAYATFSSGTPIPDTARTMYREHQPIWSGDPFETYEAYILMQTPHAVVGKANEIVTNIMERIHADHEELRSRYDLQDRRQVSLFVGWLKENAARYGIGSLSP